MEELDKNALTALTREGYRFIPLLGGEDGKKPRDTGYANREYGLADLTGNVGMMIDEHHVDVDLDWTIPRQFLAWLPDTRCGLLRINDNRMNIRHMIYRAHLPEGINFELPKVEGHPLEGPHAHMVLQLRTSQEGEAYHVMVSPSVHPDGGQICWYDTRGEAPIPSEADGAEIEKIAGRIAAASFFVFAYPGEGSRDEFALALMGALVRADWSDGEIEEFFCAVATQADDNERVRRCTKLLVNARKRLEDDRKLRGLNSMPKLLNVPKEWVNEAAIWLGIRKRHKEAAIFDNGLIIDTARQAWEALHGYEIDGDPAVFAYGDTFARIDNDQVQILERQPFTYELNRAAKWFEPGKEEGSWRPSNADPDVVNDMLSARARDVRLSGLKAVATTPVFTSDGRLITKRGYDHDAQVFLAPNIEVDVPDDPTREQVQEAVDLLHKPLADFPFEDGSDRANALAMFIEPFVRDLFDVTPMYYINKPVAGTGATLLVHACLYPALGGAPPATNPPNHDEEMEKILTSILKEGGKIVFFDNATKLKGKALAKALTEEVHSGRVLGYSRMVQIPVRVMWIATGNNPDTDNELYRRMVDVRLNANEANPEDRPAQSFTIPDLKGWVRDNRAALVRAALIIVRSWVNAGMPQGSKSKASYEKWSAVMSGILENAGVVGFLETPKERRPEDEATEWMREVAVMWLRWAHRRAPDTARAGEVHSLDLDWSEPRKANELAVMLECSEVDIGAGFSSSPARALSDRLRAFRDRIIEVETRQGVARVALRSRQVSNTTKWWLAVNEA